MCDLECKEVVDFAKSLGYLGLLGLIYIYMLNRKVEIQGVFRKGIVSKMFNNIWVRYIAEIR